VYTAEEDPGLGPYMKLKPDVLFRQQLFLSLGSLSNDQVRHQVRVRPCKYFLCHRAEFRHNFAIPRNYDFVACRYHSAETMSPLDP
jgi:hypothetical protein